MGVVWTNEGVDDDDVVEGETPDENDDGTLLDETDVEEDVEAVAVETGGEEEEEDEDDDDGGGDDDDDNIELITSIAD